MTGRWAGRQLRPPSLAALLPILLPVLLGTAASQAREPVRSLLEQRQQGVVMQRWDNSCGAAALATVLAYHLDFPITEEEVARGMLRRTDPLRVRHRGGFSLLDMKRLVEELGFVGEGYAGMELAELARRRPAIVPVRARGFDHFVVVRGLADDAVDIAAPDFGNYTMDREAFERAWHGRVAFFVRP